MFIVSVPVVRELGLNYSVYITLIDGQSGGGLLELLGLALRESRDDQNM